MTSPRRALVLVDVQRDYFDGPLEIQYPPHADSLARITQAIDTATQAGVPVIAAHMFVYFYAILSVITPPVCLAAFAGAAIAETNAMKTGATAIKLGIVAFIIPFMCVFEPALLMQGTASEVALAFASALVGVVGVASGMQNWLFVRCRLWERALLLVSGFMLIFPGLVTDALGLACLITAIVSQRLRCRSPLAA